MAETYTRQLQIITNKYMASGEPWPATAREMAEWAIRKGFWEPQPSSLVDQCAAQLARAMREERIIDPQGRVVRAKHAARMQRGDEQITLWADKRTADPRFMEISFQQRRIQIVGDCCHLKADVDSYNQNENTGASIQIPFDFTRDVLEAQPEPQAAV